MMIETLNIETADVYQAPLLVEAGDFADVTQGGQMGNWPEGGGWWFWA
ncbi:lasso RiPP family leader peptide-containing protein [Streptomyces gilvosporeus]|nr:lasso RiPP family leader peptide-containing protein [Streptomyces gilvosporeus]